MTAERRYLLEQVDDAAVVQVYADGFAALTLAQKTLAWHLYQAAIAGRDIYYDQRHRHGLAMRDLIEVILRHPEGLPPETLAEIRRYATLFWLNSGPYHNLTAQKFTLRLTPAELVGALETAFANGAVLPCHAGEPAAAVVDRLAPAFFDADHEPAVTCKTPPPGEDLLTASANNLYAGVTLADLARVEERYPLNSRIAMTGTGPVEEVYRIGGRYGATLAKVAEHLAEARAVAPPPTAAALDALIRFYTTGEDEDRERYDIAWVQDQAAVVDTINGFIEVYMDPRGLKGAWESLVYYTDAAKTARIEHIAALAQWFEDRMPWDAAYRKAGVTGVTARAIEVVIETGESGPITPLGINLPNEQAVRERHGSKSVALSNITAAYERSQHEALKSVFCWDEGELARARAWSALASEITTDLHEVIGHGSGRMAPGIDAPPQTLLKEHHSALEETRADLVALYFIADPVLVEIGAIGAADHADLVRAAYEAYARNVIVQLRRVGDAEIIEEDHFRNRQLIVHWLQAHTTAIETRVRNGDTYFVVVDVDGFREGCARLLAKVQHIKSTGDYAAAAGLVERYGMRVNTALRDEVRRRIAPFNIPVYTGFVMPRLTAVRDGSGALTDVTVSYPLDLATQMLEYAAATVDTRVADGLI